MSTPMNHNGRADRRAGSIFPTNGKESLRQQNSPAVAPLLTRQALYTDGPHPSKVAGFDPHRPYQPSS
jgi:hypothetical protein